MVYNIGHILSVYLQYTTIVYCLLLFITVLCVLYFTVFHTVYTKIINCVYKSNHMKHEHVIIMVCFYQ